MMRTAFAVRDQSGEPSQARRISQESVTYVADLRSDWTCKSKVGEPGANLGGVSLLLHDIEPFDFSVQGTG